MNWNFRMAVAAANIALYGKSYSNGRLRDIKFGCSHPLILCAMVEAVGSHRSSSRRQLLAIPSTSTARCTFLTLVIGLCRPRLETENSWQALANKVPGLPSMTVEGTQTYLRSLPVSHDENSSCAHAGVFLFRGRMRR